MAKIFFSILVVGGVLYSLYLMNPHRNIVEPGPRASLNIDENFIDASSLEAAEPEKTTEEQPKSPSKNKLESLEQLKASIDIKAFQELRPMYPPQISVNALNALRDLSDDPAETSDRAKESGELVLGNSGGSEKLNPTQSALTSTASSSGASVYFAFDSYELSPSAEESLEKLAEIVKSKPQAQVQIAGFTDAIGDPQVNQAFATARAKTVADKLTSLGVDTKKLQIVSSTSEAHPNGASATTRSSSKDRRVDISIVPRS